ncbi:MAG: leucyl aminopeptidase [Deltaproteobacteria bacterium]|nr:leucyl aminopeptidase [Deltaproteobacteria bacterium]
MKYQLTKSSLSTIDADAVLLLSPQQSVDGKPTAGLRTADGGERLDKQLGHRLSTIMAEEAFKGELGTFRLVDCRDQLRARYVVLLGMGDERKLSPRAWRTLGAAIHRAAEQIRARRVAAVIEGQVIGGLTPPQRLQGLFEGMRLAQYRCDRFRPSEEQQTPALEVFIGVPERKNTALEHALARAQIVSEATCMARTLVNLPSNVCTPRYLADVARKIARRGKLQCNIFDAKALATMRMRLLLAVGQGSAVPPVLIHLRYRPAKGAKERVALVGKGVTFDTGGYDLKPSRNMLTMHGDMAGAAAVLATMEAMAQLRPRVTIDAYIPATENCVDAAAYKPSDIIESRSGKTVEIVNTDAEGRLVLADTLDYAVEQEPTLLIDIATLTGGVKYALGEIYTAVLGSDQSLVDQLMAASRVAAEPMWQLPLEEEYLDGFKGGLATLKNCGKSGASTITGALFLSQFVGKTPWAHLDIAEASWSDEPHALGQQGGTGAPVRTLCEFLMAL